MDQQLIFTYLMNFAYTMLRAFIYAASCFLAWRAFDLMIIKKISRRYGFDWRLIAAQIFVESRFDSTARSGCGAGGLMQIMPGTSRYLGVDPLNLHNPEINIGLGCLYNSKLLSQWKKDVENREHRLAFTFASYNAGRGRVLKSFRSADTSKHWENVYPDLPLETQNYVHRIALKYDVYSHHMLP